MTELTKDILVQSLTAVLWGKMNIQQALNFASTIDAASGHLFDGSPQILDVPEDAPAEIPFIILKSKDEKYIFQASRERVDIILQETEEDGMLLHAEGGALMDKLVIKLLPEIEAATPSFESLAFVGRYIIETPGSVEFLHNKFLKNTSPLRHSHIIELNSLHIRAIAGMPTNEWIRVHSARRIEDDYDGAIGIEVDINTQKQEDFKCGGSHVVSFYNGLPGYINKLIFDYLA